MDNYLKIFRSVRCVFVVVMFVLLPPFAGGTCFAFGPGSDRDPDWDHIYNSIGVGFGVVETPTGYQPMVDVNALDLQGEHGFISFTGRFALGSYPTMNADRDGKMGFTQMNLLVGLGTPWLQVASGFVGICTDLGRDDIQFNIPYQAFDNTRKISYCASTTPLLVKVVPLRTDHHYLTASAMVHSFRSSSSADIPITGLYNFGRGETTVKGEGGITNYVDVTYNYRLTKDIRKKGWIIYVKGFYGTGEAKNLSDLNIPAGLNVNNATATVPDLKWMVKGMAVGIALDL